MKLARPQKDGMDYFPHDVYASGDEKIEPLLLLYGSKGYSFYFLHLEYIYRNSELEFDISESETREVIQQKLHISADEYNTILKSSIKYKCFDKKHYDDTGKLTSKGIKKRAISVIEKRERMRAAYELRVSAAETTHIKERKEKKSKVKESIYMGNTPKHNFIPPTMIEVEEYCTERKNNIDAGKWFDFYSSKGWMVGKNKMKDWKAAVRTWEHGEKQNNKSGQQQSGNPFKRLMEKEGLIPHDES